MTQALVDRIYHGVAALILPKPEWTHEAHLVAGCALLDEAGLAAAEARMPEMIRHYNVATGVQNTDTDGYHHTITLFYLRAIAAFMETQGDAPLAMRVTALLNSPLAHRGWPLNYYSRELLFSVEARRNWVDPDLKPLAE